MMIEWLDEMATITVAAFVNGLWLGVLLTGIVWAAIRFMSTWKPINATTRFMVWATVLVLCAGLVCWQGFRQVRVSSVKPVQFQEVSASVTHASELEPSFVATEPQQDTFVSLDGVEEPSVAFNELAEPAGTVEPLTQAGPSFKAAPDPIEWSAIGPVLRRLLFIAWILGSSLLMLRTGYSIFAIRRLKRRSHPAPLELSQRLHLLTIQIHRPRRVRIGLSDDIDIAVATGLLNPMILVPASLPQTLTSQELDQVLLHEFAHLQRRDDWTIFFQLLLTNLLFFHPAMYVLGKLMEREREFACDDWVVALTHRPKAYASCLAKIVSMHRQAHKKSLAPAIVSRKEQLFERVGEILNRNRTVSFQASRRGYTVILCLMAIVMLGAMRFAPVIALTEPAIAFLERPVVSPVQGESMSADLVAPTPEEESVSLGPMTAESLAMPDPVVITAEQASEKQSPVASGEDALEEAAAISSELFNVKPDRAIPLPVPVSTAQIEAVNFPEPQVKSVDTQRRDSTMSNASMVKLLRASQKIASSGDRAQLLMQAAQKLSSEEIVILAYLESVSSIASSGDRGRALDALLKYERLEEQGAIAFLNVVQQIPSSGDKSRILIKSLDNKSLPIERQPVREAFLQTLDTIASSGDYRRVSEHFVRYSMGR